MKKYIIYHDKCPDGLTAAALFKTHAYKYNYEDIHNYEFIPGNYNMTLDDLAAKFEQYRENLIKLTEASKNGQNTTQIEKEIIDYLEELRDNNCVIDGIADKNIEKIKIIEED